MLRFDLVVGHLDNGLWARSIKNKKKSRKLSSCYYSKIEMEMEPTLTEQ